VTLHRANVLYTLSAQSTASFSASFCLQQGRGQWGVALFSNNSTKYGVVSGAATYRSYYSSEGAEEVAYCDSDR
jgi:hypothetical protein